jgi:hypothetical protein
MSGPFEDVGEHELAFFFQTNEPIPARPLLNFLYEVERIALTQRHLGPSAVVEITEVRTGTKSVRLTFNQTLLAAGVAIAAGTLAVEVARLGLDIADRLQQQPRGRLAESVAEMCLDYGVVESTISTHYEQIRIPRNDMPALRALEEKRSGAPTRQSASRPPFPLQIDNAVSKTEMEAVRSSDFVAQRGEILAEVSRARDGRVYTVVGSLSAPGMAGNVVPRSRGQFRTQSGKTYIVRGLDWDRAPRKDEPVVIRAEIDGRDGEFVVLNVKDVFEPQEP